MPTYMGLKKYKRVERVRELEDYKQKGIFDNKLKIMRYF